MISLAYLNWQTVIIQMKKQSCQIIIFFNVVSQFVLSITKLKHKLIVMFSLNENFIFMNTQRALSKQIVKFTKHAQIIRMKIIRIKRAKIHEKSIEFLIFFLIFETTHIKRKNALFVNKHVSFN
jgi:hypothetical protein